MAVTESNERASVPAILADLIMLGQLHKLPDPINMEACEANGCGGVKLRSFADQARWVETLGIEQSGPPWTTSAGDEHVQTAYLRKDGWFIAVEAKEPVGSAHTELTAETLTALDHIANPPAAKPAVSDVRAQEILDELNSFIDHDYEGDTEIHLGREVQVRTIVGSDFNLDKAIAWALDQEETESTGGPCANGAEVVLVDGTTIVWSPDIKAWEFAVPEVAQ